MHPESRQMFELLDKMEFLMQSTTKPKTFKFFKEYL